MTTTVQHVKEFGYYPDPLPIKTGPVTISSLPDLEQIANGVRASSSIENNWYYAPPQQVRDLPSREVRERPYPTRVFGLPKTHRIEHTAATNEEHLDFHLWALSFFVGMRLTAAATENGFLDATPVKPHKLVDFIPVCSSLTHAVELAEDFWNMTRDKPCCAKRFGAAVHALFLSQNPRNLPFEECMVFRSGMSRYGLKPVTTHSESDHVPTGITDHFRPEYAPSSKSSKSAAASRTVQTMNSPIIGLINHQGSHPPRVLALSGR